MSRLGELVNWFTTASGVLVILALTAYVSYLVYRRRERKRLLRENQVLMMENSLIKEYYSTLQNQIERTRRFRHDIDEHISVLEELVHQGTTPRFVEQYVNELESQYRELVTIEYCEDMVLNAVLVNRIEQCVREKIQIRIDMTGYQKNQIRDLDLVTIVVNLFDNAIEECHRLGAETERKIEFRCGIIADCFTIQISNTTELEDGSEAVNSTLKQDKFSHGLGLAIVRQLVDEYKGVINITISGGIFEVFLQIQAGNAPK